MPAGALTLSALRIRLVHEQDQGGLIFIKHRDTNREPMNFTVRGSTATSGVWQRGLTGRPISWVLIYQRLDAAQGRVWTGEYVGPPAREKGGYRIRLRGVKGPLMVPMTLRDLTGMHHPQNPVYLGTPTKPAHRPAASEAHDVAELVARQDMSATERERLVQARLGQGRFRTEVLRQWQGACAVTGATTVEAIRASHIRPWQDCKDEPALRLDPNNGLPLVATLDALFDQGLITFTATGRMLVADALCEVERMRFGVPANLLQAPSVAQARLLAYHRRHVYIG